MPRVSKVALSDGHLRNFPKVKFPEASVDQPHKQAFLSQGCYGNSCTELLGELNDSGGQKLLAESTCYAPHLQAIVLDLIISK